MKSEKGVDIHGHAGSASFLGMFKKEESLMEHIQVDLISPAFQIRVSQEILAREPSMVAERARFKGLNGWRLLHMSLLVFNFSF
jgi:hypothetical protein